MLGGVVVQQAQHDPALLVKTRQQQPRRLSGPEHDGASDLTVLTHDARARVFVGHAIDHAHQHQAHQGHHRMQGQHRPWHFTQPQTHHHRGGYGTGQDAGHRDALDFGEA